MDKRNIRDLSVDFEVLLGAIPKTYTREWDPDRWEIGFFSEDFHVLGLTPLVEYDTHGHADGIRYDRMETYLVPILKKQVNKSKIKIKELLLGKGNEKFQARTCPDKSPSSNSEDE